MQKKLFSYLRVSLLSLLAAIVGINVYSWNASRVAGNALPMPFGVGAAVVLSGSMEPEISVGDLLIVAECNSYEIGDVVVYQDGRMAVTHRIVAISEDEVITKGDANNTEDEPITVEQIKGEVVVAIPLAGYAVNAIKTPIGTLCILGLAIFLLERSFRTKKKRDEEQINAIKTEIEKIKQKQNNQ